MRLSNRILVTALFLASALQGEVYMSARGKTYHADRRCTMLARSKEVRSADEADAKGHGLTPCKRCYGLHTHTAAAGKKDPRPWARKVY